MTQTRPDWSRYAIGGATRPDSFNSMTPEMQQGLWGMLQAADAELGSGLQVYSGYRSPELQAELFDAALKKYGSEAAARKWVAPPGRSKHNTGQAADLKWNGVRIDQLPEDHPARAWLSQNVAQFGLAQPMSWEPWQVEQAGARGQQPQPMTYGKLGPAPTEPTQPPMDYGALLDGAEPQGPDYAGLLEAIGAMEAQPQPALMPARQIQPYQPVKRDTTQPYMALFQQLMG